MSYAPATIPNLADNEAGYQLTSDPGNGCLVAARWECIRRLNNTLELCWYVRQVDSDGSAVHDRAGGAITGTGAESIYMSEINISGGIDVVKQQLLEVALGEPDAIRDAPHDIRDAIQAAVLVSSG